MITDFNDLESIIRSAKSDDTENLKIEFNFDDPDNGPFRPLLSLFCLMPPTSVDLLP